jgi:hypothetical protein
MPPRRTPAWRSHACPTAGSWCRRRPRSCTGTRGMRAWRRSRGPGLARSRRRRRGPWPRRLWAWAAREEIASRPLSVLQGGVTALRRRHLDSGHVRPLSAWAPAHRLIHQHQGWGTGSFYLVCRHGEPEGLLLIPLDYYFPEHEIWACPLSVHRCYKFIQTSPCKFQLKKIVPNKGGFSVYRLNIQKVRMYECCQRFCAAGRLTYYRLNSHVLSWTTSWWFCDGDISYCSASYWADQQGSTHEKLAEVTIWWEFGNASTVSN